MHERGRSEGFLNHNSTICNVGAVRHPGVGQRQRTRSYPSIGTNRLTMEK